MTEDISMKTLTTEKKSTLLTDETFNKLRLAQRQIQDKTDFSPSFRYLINHVINDNSIEQSINRLINEISNSGLFELSTKRSNESDEGMTND